MILYVLHFIMASSFATTARHYCQTRTYTLFSSPRTKQESFVKPSFLSAQSRLSKTAYWVRGADESRWRPLAVTSSNLIAKPCRSDCIDRRLLDSKFGKAEGKLIFPHDQGYGDKAHCVECNSLTLKLVMK